MPVMHLTKGWLALLRNKSGTLTVKSPNPPTNQAA